MLYVLLFLGLILYYLYKFYSDVRNNWPPGPTPLPLIGNLHQLNFFDLTESFGNFSKQYGPVFRLSFPQHTIQVTDYELIKQALQTNGWLESLATIVRRFQCTI